MTTRLPRIRPQLAGFGLHTPRLLRGPRIETAVRHPVIHTPRLVLRPHRLDDADQWYEIESDDAVLRYLSWPQRTRAQSFQHLRDRTKHTVLSQSDDLLALAIELDGRLVGDVSLHLREVHPGHRSAEVGWILSPLHRGEGIAHEAVNGMLVLAFKALKAKEVFAVVDARNQPSARLASRLGFTADAGNGSRVTFVLNGENCTRHERHASPTR